MYETRVDILNCTVVGNSEYGLRVGSALGPVEETITDCILWDNGDDLVNCAATYSNISDGDPGEGNISADPLFIDPANDDYHLAFGSPCVDTGTDTGIMEDFEGDPRPLDGDVSGTAEYDMGADEFNVEPYGWLDVATATEILGWGYDPDAGTSPIGVEFYFDGPAGSGTYAATVTANLYRPDVPINVPSVQGDYHGFTWDPKDFMVIQGYAPGSMHDVYVYLINYPAGTNPLLDIKSITTANIIKGPYLQDVTQTSIRVRWETKAGSDSRVDYGPTSSYGTHIAGDYSTYLSESDTYLHEIQITGLSEETTYHYMVTTSGYFSADHSFNTAIQTDTPFRFAVYSDNQGGPTMHKEITNAIIGNAPKIVVIAGDLVEHSTDYSDWGQLFFGPSRNLYYEIPFFAAVGNHDTYEGSQPGDTIWVNHFVYFPTADRWWSFDFGNAHFILLDSIGDPDTSFGPGTSQYNWLESDLNGTEQEWLFVFFHIPPYSSGEHGGDEFALKIREYLVPLFEAYDVDIVFNGHDHLYERSAKDGVYYIVTGGAGGGLHEPNQNTNPYQEYVESTHHYCTVDISGSQLLHQARYPNGEVFDSLSLEHPAP
jgi:predicted phosphodiesterase